MSEDVLEIEAKITEWRTGAHGLYALARVLSADAPVKSALCAQNIRGITPVLGVPFKCWITQTNQGWRVSEIIIDGLPRDLVDVAGIISMEPVSKSSSRVWTIKTEPLPEGVKVAVKMDVGRLRAMYLAEIDVGTSVRFDAVRGERGYEVTRLSRPTPAEALPFSPADVPCHTIVALIEQDWTVDDHKKGVVIRFRSAAGAPVSASAFIRASMLRAAGPKRPLCAIGPTPPSQAESDDLLSKWSAALRSNDRNDRDRIEVDRLEVEVEWVASSSQWRVARLLRPRALRLPAASGEIVDWVHGTVLGRPCRITRDALKAEPKQAEDAREGQDEPGSSVQLVTVDVDYEDARVGCGRASLRLAEKKAHAAGLALGVGVTVCLKSREDYWNIAALHQSRPSEAEALP